MSSDNFKRLETVKNPNHLAGIMTATMRGTTCARTKTSKVPT